MFGVEEVESDDVDEYRSDEEDEAEAGEKAPPIDYTFEQMEDIVDRHNRGHKFTTIQHAYCLYGFDIASPCHFARCRELPLLRCAYCGHCFCHEHCLINLHQCR